MNRRPRREPPARETSRQRPPPGGLLPAGLACCANRVRLVLEEVTLADIVDGRFPCAVAELIADPAAWNAR